MANLKYGKEITAPEIDQESHIFEFSRTAKPVSREARIPRVVIVGAGFVGSTTAYALMMTGMATEIVLVESGARACRGACK